MLRENATRPAPMNKGKKVSRPKVTIGTMIETPRAALRAEELAEASEESKRTGKKVVRKSKKKKTDITLPDGKFTMKMLVAETGMSQPTLYIMLQNLVKQGVVQEVERVRVEGQRGRNTVVYSSVK